MTYPNSIFLFTTFIVEFCNHCFAAIEIVIVFAWFPCRHYHIMKVDPDVYPSSYAIPRNLQRQFRMGSANEIVVQRVIAFA